MFNITYLDFALATRSHAERGKSWRGLGLAGIQPNHRRFTPTHFLAGML